VGKQRKINENIMSEEPKKQKRNTSGLIPFKKGHKGGPGRPKMPDLKEILTKVLGAENEEGKSEAEQILEALKKQAKAGNVKASQLLLDRGWGKVKEQIDITTNEESLNKPSIQIEIITTNKDEHKS
jgi:hypothetical protein